MMKIRIFLYSVLAVWLLAGILLLGGCGKKEDDSLSTTENHSYSETLKEETEGLIPTVGRK